MKAHSIQFNFLITVISAIPVIAFFVGAFSIYEVDDYVQQHTEEFIAIRSASEAAEVNDTYGHDNGNKLIAGAARIISETFKRSPAFRIGGDEFPVILQNRDLEERDTLFAELDARAKSAAIEVGDTKVPVSIAKGFSLFDPQTDTRFSDVFTRADDEMYKNKKTMKTAPM